MCTDCLSNGNCDETMGGGDGECFCDDGVGGSIDSAESEGDCLAAWRDGMAALAPEAALVCLGEMGIGNTPIAAALSIKPSSS